MKKIFLSLAVVLTTSSSFARLNFELIRNDQEKEIKTSREVQQAINGKVVTLELVQESNVNFGKKYLVKSKEC